MIQVVVVDDERLAIDELTYLLGQLDHVKVIGSFTESEKALEFVFNHTPDLVFLDINMPVLNGMLFAEALRAAKVKTKVVFATAYDDYAVKAFEKNAFDYILKPYEFNRIQSLIERFKEDQMPVVKPVSKLSIWKGEKVVFVDLSDIVYCEVCNNQTMVFTQENCFEVPQTLSALENMLPINLFMRTHRNFIINKDKVLEASPYFNQTMVVRLLGCNKDIPISRHYVKAFKVALNIL